MRKKKRMKRKKKTKLVKLKKRSSPKLLLNLRLATLISKPIILNFVKK